MNTAAVSDAVRAALGKLILVAGVEPGDSPDAARQRLRRALREAGCHGPANDPTDCPLGTWMFRETGLRVLVTPVRCVVTQWVLGVRHQAVVPLPPEVAAVVSLIDRRLAPELTDERRAA